MNAQRHIHRLQAESCCCGCSEIREHEVSSNMNLVTPYKKSLSPWSSDRARHLEGDHRLPSSLSVRTLRVTPTHQNPRTVKCRNRAIQYAWKWMVPRSIKYLLVARFITLHCHVNQVSQLRFQHRSFEMLYRIPFRLKFQSNIHNIMALARPCQIKRSLQYSEVVMHKRGMLGDSNGSQLPE